jgi:peptide/nickel transport system substrate-binding protein/microcin C transport system substrate-binding protein
VPSDAELALLEPYRGQIPDAAFGPMYVQPSTRPPSSLRKNLTRALELLAASGWHDDHGVLKNAEGEPFVIEVSGARNQNPYLDPYYLNLTRLGFTIKKRLTDAPSARQRMNKFDFDFMSVALREGRMPGAELWRTFNSKDADVPGSENVAGVKSHAVDELIQRLLDASSQAELETVAHALDRVLVHSHYVVPWRYLTQHYVIFNEKLQRPDKLPPYSGAYDWAVGAWWDGSSAPKAASASATPSGARPARAWGWYASAAAIMGLLVLLAGRARRGNALSRS